MLAPQSINCFTINNKIFSRISPSNIFPINYYSCEVDQFVEKKVLPKRTRVMSEIINGDSMKNRFRGALLGVLVGDCFGAPFEGRRVDPNLAQERINKLVETDKELKFTDDTAMTISTCRSLIENRGLDPRNLAKHFSEMFFREPHRGYGGAVRQVFSLLRESQYQDPFGPATIQFDGNGSFGNGAAMRCNGIALFAHKNKLNLRKTLDLVENCSRITHSHRDAINGAICLVLAIKQALNLEDDSVDEFAFLNTLIESMKEVEGAGQEHVYTDKLKLMKQEMDQMAICGKEISQAMIVKLLGNDVSALGSVPLAIYSFLRGISKFRDRYGIENEFVRTLHWAISCGGDTDTIASMACGICGAYLGMSKLPENYYKRCEAWNELVKLADGLCNA